MRTITCKVIDVNPTTGEQLCYKEMAGLSTEDKPTTGLVSGSSVLEVDTQKVAFFDETNSTWYGGTVGD